MRAAFRAASLAMPMRVRVAAPRCAAALGERLVLRRSRAERVACRESAAFDAAPRPSRCNAFETAPARSGDRARGFLLALADLLSALCGLPSALRCAALALPPE